jgi:hypothetical protein
MGIPLSVLDPSCEDVDPYLLEHQQPRFRCKLPLELLVIVTEFLLGDQCYETAANLNITCKNVQVETSSALYAAVVWDFSYFEAVANMTTFGGRFFKWRDPESAYRLIQCVEIRPTSGRDVTDASVLNLDTLPSKTFQRRVLQRKLGLMSQPGVICSSTHTCSRMSSWSCGNRITSIQSSRDGIRGLRRLIKRYPGLVTSSYFKRSPTA